MLRTLSALLIGSALLTSARADIPFHAGADKKTEPPAPAKSTEKIVEEINTDLGKVVDQLTKSDPGATTRAGQDRILENIDLLLKQQDPSPPKNSSQSPPPNSPPPKNPSSNQSDPKPSAGNPLNQPKLQPMPPATSKPDAKPKQQPAGSEQQSQKPNSLEELKKEMKDEKWPPLPPRLRQEMDAASRAQFIRNYEELLRAYYRNLAESSRRTHVD